MPKIKRKERAVYDEFVALIDGKKKFEELSREALELTKAVLKEASNRKVMEAILREALSAVPDLMASGDLAEENLNRKDIMRKMANLTLDGTISYGLDHRDVILSTALQFYEDKRYIFALCFYAMYFEHTINVLIGFVLRNRGVSYKSQVELIRSVNTRGKFSWLLELLGLPAFNDKHRNVVKKAAEERNAMIHYKWKMVPNDEFFNNGGDEEIIKLLEKVRKTVTYLKRYESKVLYKGKKGKLLKELWGR